MKPTTFKILSIFSIACLFLIVRCTCTGSSETKTAAEIQQEQKDSISASRERKIDLALTKLKDMVKKQMKDPDSFKMMDRTWDKKDTADVVKLVIRYTGKNSFGANVQTTTFGTYNMSNETVTITKTED